MMRAKRKNVRDSGELVLGLSYDAGEFRIIGADGVGSSSSYYYASDSETEAESP